MRALGAREVADRVLALLPSDGSPILNRVMRVMLSQHFERSISEDLYAEARDLLEQEFVALREAFARQHEGRADVGMAGKGHFGLGREDADVRGMRGVFGRQHEGRLGVIELRRDRLHLRSGEALGIEHDGQGIAAERAVGEDIDGDVSAFHFSNLAHRASLPA